MKDTDEEIWDAAKKPGLLWYALIIVAVVIVALVLFNASWIAGQQPGRLELIANNGLYQQPAADSDDPCPSARIAAEQPHSFIDNTGPAIVQAYASRASRVEIAVRPTADGRLVLFADESVDCRTQGEGAVRDLTLEQIRALDPGYGLTPDGSRFPLRGREGAAIPALADMLRSVAPDGLIIRFADPDPAQAAMLETEYAEAGNAISDRAIIMGAPALLAAIRTRHPQARLLDNRAAEACFDGYLRSGWYGGVPGICEGGFISVPLDRQWMIWGWPNRFLARMRGANVTPMVVRTHSGTDAPVPLDSFEEMRDVPESFRGMLWLSDIYQMGPALRG